MLGVGSGVGSGLERHQEIQYRFRENTPPPTPTATSEVSRPRPRGDPKATRPGPPSRRLSVIGAHWRVRHTDQCGNRSVGGSSLTSQGFVVS